MSIKCNYSEIEQIYNWYYDYADDKMQQLYNTQPTVYDLAYCENTHIGLVIVDSVPYKVVTVYGQVKAVMPANIPKYKSTYIADKTLIAL